MLFLEEGETSGTRSSPIFTPTSSTQTGDIGEVGGVLKRSITIHATKIRQVRDQFLK
jgi:hypothetical protein